MIGPIFRSPPHLPRALPLAPGRGRRLENAVSHWVETLLGRLGLWRRQELRVERCDLALAGLARSFDGYRIAFVSDLHFSAVVPAWWIAHAVAAVNALGADLVLLGGDYVSHSAEYAWPLVDLLRPLAAPDGVFGVLGNHDHYVGAAVVRAALQQAGVIELRNRSALVGRGADSLAVAGVGDLRFDAIDFAAAVGEVPAHVPRVVVSHDPDVFAFWPPHLRLDLMLSGHTHGGQAHLPWLGPPYVPSQFGSRYLAGLFREDGRQLYVSRGVGAITAPVRWRCPPEITLVVLHPS